MAWTSLTFAYGSVLTSLKMTQMQANFDALAAGDAGAPTVAVTGGGTGRVTGVTAYGLLAAGTTAAGVQQTLAVGATNQILVGGGAGALPVWTAATGTGAPVRATAPTFTSSGTTNTITVQDTGASGANIKLVGNGATTPNKYIRVISGFLSVVNSDYTVSVLSLSDTGNLTVTGVVRGNTATGATTASAVVGVASDTGTGVYGSSTNGYGIVAEGDTTAPAKAAFRIVPQDAQPTGASAIGDMYVTNTAGTEGILKICIVAGTPGTWVSVGAQT